MPRLPHLLLLAVLCFAIAVVAASPSALVDKDGNLLDRPLRLVSPKERLAAGLPSNICPDSTFSLFRGSTMYFCYQSAGHPVPSPAALPFCPTFGISPLATVGVYAPVNATMGCPANTVHVQSSLEFVPSAATTDVYDFCFYKITLFPQQSQFFSYCYHWWDTVPFGVGYAFVWTQ